MSKKKSNWWYRQTEAILYAAKGFPIKIKALQQQREMILESIEPSIISNYNLIEGTNYCVSSPVEAIAIKRADGDPVVWLDRRIKNLITLSEIVADSVVTMLNEEEQEMVELIYNKNLTWQTICEAKSFDKNTFYLKKNAIVSILAWCFNYMPDEVAEEALGIFMDQALWQSQYRKARE